ncbi:DUF6509 family protein [Niallia sp. Krafla_26]|uniref:DUF6509 family protein n=1 Tax=Niallia sp. Krafla_26 TaxID=3064703 RepID=UPI003D16FCB3
MNITEYTVEKIKDPTGILSGDRYEFYLTIEVPEDDDLADEQGLQLKVLYGVEENFSKILLYHFYNSIENNYLDFELEEDEVKLVDDFCRSHYQDAE